ncbi:hypothetical protein AXF42_Ash001387 [Apostasia shenzhenica]|uniref:Uncharacterized protein n=1 Tax=Apostasia shenzhenica TaxID=1088818 RepID=A0A2I0AUR8_9ASPA|nr:hypothetical protein AXF42_Ash001387 [Apostasia shenzhenica]
MSRSRCRRAVNFVGVMIIFAALVLAVSMQSTAAARPTPAVSAGEMGAKEVMALWMMRLPSGPSDRGAGH